MQGIFFRHRFWDPAGASCLECDAIWRWNILAQRGDEFEWSGVVFVAQTGQNSAAKLDANVAIGHVHLKVADLERALKFYNGVLGFEITQRYGKQAAFLSAGGYHHHIGLNTWESQGGRASAAG